MKSSFLFFVFSISISLKGQFAPPAGEPGSTAIHGDSSIFVAWANFCTVSRGLQQIDNPSYGYASGGDELMALLKPGANGTLSLGDGGSAIVQFEHPIRNGEGPDFAVFENSFDGQFLELAYVEVSSDGVNYFRFPSISLTDTLIQKGTFDLLDARQIHNLAGKYRLFYGTPFDLNELADNPGLDLNAITHVKIIDVVGVLNSVHTQRDVLGNPINDPWPTPFFSGGFDLDAVGVIHSANPQAISANHADLIIRVFPNPTTDIIHLKSNENIDFVLVYNQMSTQVLNLHINKSTSSISFSDLPVGVYYLKIQAGQKISTHKIVKI